MPGLVRSGGGVHAYWVLDCILNPEEWLHTAQRLKLLIASAGLLSNPSDLAVTADIARILRAPGTQNYKLPRPRPVEVIDEAYFEPVSYENFNASVIKAPCGTIKEALSMTLAPLASGKDANANLTAGIKKSMAVTGLTCKKKNNFKIFFTH